MGERTMLTKRSWPALLITLSLAAPAFAQSVDRHRGARQQDPQTYAKQIKKACDRWDLDRYLLMGLIQTESRFDPGATSRTGAAGMGQFTSIGIKEIQRLAKVGRYAEAFQSSAKDKAMLARLTAFNKDRAYEPGPAIEAAALYLHHLLRTYKQNVEAALTHYNAGGRMAKHVQKHGFKKAKAKGLLTFSQAKTYAPHVLEWRAKFKKGWRP